MMQAIILAGGLGTRLRTEVPDVPKPMAPVAGRPFLEILLDNLIGEGVDDVVLAVGYKHQIIVDHFGHEFLGVPIRYSVEDIPLGTGGALVKAMANVQAGSPCCVVNGDTFVQVDLRAMRDFYISSGSDICLCVTPVTNASRYGRVVIGSDHRVNGFQEKGEAGPGYINSGVYFLTSDMLSGPTVPQRFSFEDTILVERLDSLFVAAFESRGAFIDIGIPEDFRRANLDVELFTPSQPTTARR